MNLLFAKVMYLAGMFPMSSGILWLKLLLLMKRTSRDCVKTWGGTDPEKELKRMSRKVKAEIARTAGGNSPENLLLLRSSS